MRKTMKKNISRLAVILIAVSLVTVAGLMACTTEPQSAPRPGVSIDSPMDGSELPADDVTVNINVSDFSIVEKLGQSAASGEGHVHYYLDAEPPTIPGQPAVTGPGTYAATTETSHTWENVGPGTHTFSVQLVNNNHTPLEPAATAKVVVNVVQSMTGTAPSAKIMSPDDGSALTAGDIEVSVDISDFSLASKLGQDAIPGEGHIHFYMDVEVPTEPGKPAVSAAGTYAVGTAASHTWRLVGPGLHTFSAQLVNNNHTPLDPPVVDTIEVTVESKQFSLVPGLYRDRQVEYYDFGANTPLVDGKVLTAPIYALITGMDVEGNPQFVDGQHNIVDAIPGDPGYSDLWQVNLVTVPEDYQADSIKSFGEIVEGGFTVTASDILVNCPIVPPGSTLETDMELTQGWYKGKAVYYFDYGANPDIAAPIYALITGMDAQGNPQFVSGQKNIIDVVPGDGGYSAFWQVNLVTVPQDYVADTFKSAADVADSGYAMNETDILVNCPVINVGGEAVTINQSARNTSFDKSRITVPPGATVSIVFTNNDGGIPHNFALFETPAANTPIFVGEVITGVRMIEYTFTAPGNAGTYFFRCNIHPTIMRGDFVVEEGAASSGGDDGGPAGGGGSSGY